MSTEDKRAQAREIRRAARVPDDPPREEAGIGADEPVTLPGFPAYPSSGLSGPLADLVSSTTLPAPLVAGAGLGALAGVSGNADLEMPDGSLVRPALWVPLVAPRGAGKSPAQDKAFGKLRELDAVAHDQYRTELSEYLATPAKNRAAAGMPRDTTRRIDDATLEVIARWLDNGDGTGVVESDELSGWLQSIGQYKKTSGDKGRWLSMWSASPWRYQRVGSDRSGAIAIDFYIQRPVVSIVGGIQPHLHHLLGDADSGFRPRWLPHIAPLETVTWGSHTHKPDEWDSCIEKLFTTRGNRRWTMTGETLAIWQRETAEWKSQARGPENSSASAALDKSDIQCARIALVIAESMNPGAGGEIPAEAMHCAVAITDYVMHCWRALPGHETFALSHRDEILSRKVDELANWLETRAAKKATKTEIKQSHIAGVRTTADADTLLMAYQAVYPGTVTQHKPEGGGRPGTLVSAPQRRPRNVTTITSAHTTAVSGRPETALRGADQDSAAKSQVARPRGVSGQMARNSLARNSVARNSATDSDDVTLCALCSGPLNRALADAGLTTHPACEPETEQCAS